MAFSLSARNGGKMNLLLTSRSLFWSLPEPNRARWYARSLSSSSRCHHFHFHPRTSDIATTPYYGMMTGKPPHSLQRRCHSFRATQPIHQENIIRPGQKIIIDPGGGNGNSNSNKKSPQRRIKKKPLHSKPLPFIDRIHLKTRGGGGGSGGLSYHKLGAYKQRACGGHGGRGGNVYLATDPTLSSLKMEKHHYSGQDGVRGGHNGKHGKNGKDTYIRVPCGVVVRRVLNWEEMEEMYAENNDGEEEDEEENDDDEDDDENDELEAQSSEENDDDTDDEEDYDDSETDEHLEAASHELDVDDEEDTDDDQDENDESIDNDNDEDFDTSYEEYQSSKRQKKRNFRRGGIPSDYDETVDQGVRAEDGMYHWSVPETSMQEVDMLASTAYPNYEYDNPMRKTIFLADLDQPHTSLLVAEGGKNGVGNKAYANRPHTSTIMEHSARKAVPGVGECTYLELELKLIADVGLVGFPNAGKSSLLSAMSRANPKIASYPFTTLHPLVGSIHYKDGYRVVMADVPGLIDGAAEGRGKGIEFLRHIERTKALLYMVDVGGVDGRDPVNDLKILGKELREYGSSGIYGENEIGDDDEGEYGEEMRRRRREIMQRPSLILANKMDLIPEEEAEMGRREELLFQLGQVAEEVGIVVEERDIMGISAGVTGEGLRVLSKRLRQVVKEVG